ncbi:MAG: M23 family metallopeptidase [Bacteroidota bacterium]
MTDQLPTRWQRIRKKLHDKYRLVIMNDSTFERKLSFRLTRLNVFVAVGAVAIVLVIGTTFIIAYTPLREYIPGYGDVNLQKEIFQLTLRTDSMERDIAAKNKYILNLRYIIEGKTIPGNDSDKPSDTVVNKYKDLDFTISKEDSELRNEFENGGQYNLTFSDQSSAAGTINSFFFFPPIKGILTSGFNPKTGHFAVDIVTKKNEAVKATLDGTVILACWTLETGYIIAIQHQSNIISVYKHNSVLLKKEGEYVKVGDPIAIVGESGELSTGPHLHFELWYNGRPVNPKDYMSF